MSCLAERLNVTPRTISRYEKDGAPYSQLPLISSALEFPSEFFLRPAVEAPKPSHVNFRAGRRASAKERNAAIAAAPTGYNVNGWIQKRFLLSSPEIPDLSQNDPKQAARILREFWGLGNAPAPNLVQLLESKGVRVFGLPTLADAVDAYSVWNRDEPYIFLARKKTPERVRFDLAHELGHLVLHAGEDSSSSAGQESEADEFASEFLIPESGVVEHVSSTPTVDHILKVKEYYQVSAMAMTVGAFKAGRISEWVYRQSCMELSRRGYRSGEPGGMSEHERSRVFQTVFSSKRTPRLTASMVARDLAEPLDHIHSFVFGASLTGLVSNNLDLTPRGSSPSSMRHSLRIV